MKRTKVATTSQQQRAFFSSPGLKVHHNAYGILVSPRRFQNQALTKELRRQQQLYTTPNTPFSGAGLKKKRIKTA